MGVRFLALLIQVGLSSVPAALTVALSVAQAWSGWGHSEFKHCSTLLVLYLLLTGQPCVHTPQCFASFTVSPDREALYACTALPHQFLTFSMQGNLACGYHSVLLVLYSLWAG